MPVPIVAVVGRPNVGKSTFVNRIAQSQDAIVHEQAGVTRDRSYHRAEWNGVDFMLVDTGGIEMATADAFGSSIRGQALAAAEEADAVVFIVDGQTGVQADDEEVARLLKRSKTPVFLVVNKMDNPAKEEAIHEFWALGLGDPRPVSSVHGHGTGDVLDDLVAALPLIGEDEAADEIRVAIIGRPNAGKSSLLNKLAGAERSIVSEVAGTTRDSIDTVVELGETTYRLIDTAGLRRQSKIDESVEYYSFVRALRSIDRADVALLVVDASLGVTDQDQRVARFAEERGCALVVLLNKWDALEDDLAKEAVEDDLPRKLHFVDYAPVLRISALTGRGVAKILGAVDAVYEAFSSEIPTSALNKLLTEMREFGHTVSKGKRTLRVNYVTQTGTKPPIFTFFCNHPSLADDNFRRYTENRLRGAFELTGTPIRLRFRSKGEK
ncbi:MAG: ribosome biogenesis GTPase Der [Actinobacteria bacterium]|nr:MAG: ribosome biogenesis GTPase Der [Actinomycetota bacterium]